MTPEESGLRLGHHDDSQREIDHEILYRIHDRLMIVYGHDVAAGDITARTLARRLGRVVDRLLDDVPGEDYSEFPKKFTGFYLSPKDIEVAEALLGAPLAEAHAAVSKHWSSST